MQHCDLFPFIRVMPKIILSVVIFWQLKFMGNMTIAGVWLAKHDSSHRQQNNRTALPTNSSLHHVCVEFTRDQHKNGAGTVNTNNGVDRHGVLRITDCQSTSKRT